MAKEILLQDENGNQLLPKTKSSSVSYGNTNVEERITDLYNQIIYITDDMVQRAGSLFDCIRQRMEEGFNLIECSLVKISTVETKTLHVGRPIKIIFPRTLISFANCSDGEEENDNRHAIVIESHNVVLQGQGRSSNGDIAGGTRIVMLFSNRHPCYHVYGFACKSITISDIDFLGSRSPVNTSFTPTNLSTCLYGCGGIYLERNAPGVSAGGNSINNLIIQNVLVYGTYAHGIYLDGPIVSSIRNTRIGQCGGHCLYIEGGTSMCIDSVYCASSNLAGMCLQGISYCSVINSVCEYARIGFYIRGCRGVTLFSPGIEVTYALSTSPWNGNKGLQLPSPSGYTPTDVSGDDKSEFRGHGFFISGGQDLTIFTPYIVNLCASLDAYPASTNARFIKFAGNCRSMNVIGGSYQYNTASGVRPKHDIHIGSSCKDIDINWSVKECTSQRDRIPLDDDNNPIYISDVSTIGVPIYSQGTNVCVHGGNKFYTKLDLPNSNSSVPTPTPTPTPTTTTIDINCDGTVYCLLDTLISSLSSITEETAFVIKYSESAVIKGKAICSPNGKFLTINCSPIYFITENYLAISPAGLNTSIIYTNFTIKLTGEPCTINDIVQTNVIYN